MDKVRTKMVWAAAGIPTPRFEVIEAGSDWSVWPDASACADRQAGARGSTIGLTKVTEAAGLAQAYALAARHDAMVMAEEFISGEELTGGFLGTGIAVDPHRGAQGNYDYQNNTSAIRPSITARADWRQPTSSVFVRW